MSAASERSALPDVPVAHVLAAARADGRPDAVAPQRADRRRIAAARRALRAYAPYGPTAPRRTAPHA